MNTGFLRIAASIIAVVLTPTTALLAASEYLNAFVADKAGLLEAVRSIGKVEKDAFGALFYIRKNFGPIHYDINVLREQVCERIVVGQRTIEAVPAVPKHEEDVVEWRCGSLFGDEREKAKVQE